MSFRNIVVPLDGSRFGEVALSYATSLARSAGARLHLVIAHEPVAALVGMGESFPPPDFDEAGRVREQEYLAETAAGVRDRTGGLAVEFRALEGPAGIALVEEIQRLGADLVVMSTHGRGAMGRLWFGSVADHVVRHVDVPVLLVRPSLGKAEAAGAPGELGSILVTLDLSPESERILEPVIQLATLTQGHVTLTHFLEPVLGFVEPSVPYPVPVDPAILELNRAKAQRYLDRVADRLRDRGISVNTRVLDADGVPGNLLRALAGKQFDLVAMTTHGRGGLKRLFLGSVADKVIRGGTKPVLVVRPPIA